MSNDSHREGTVALYSLGSNGNHQLSLNHNEDVSEPNLCTISSETSLGDPLRWQIASGGNHTFLLTETGKLFATGTNEYNQLGLPITTKLLPHFTRVHASRAWTHVACGFDFSVLVGEEGVFVAGSNDKGALGLGKDIHRTTALQRIPFDLRGRRVTHLAASMNHVVMVLDYEELYGWGNNRHGALGNVETGNESGKVSAPTRLEFELDSSRIQAVTIGKNWTIVLTDSKAYYKGIKGRFIIDVDDIDVSTVSSMSSNWSTVHFLQSDGSVLSSGRHDRGQFPPQALPPLTQLTSGSEHSLGIGRDGKVYAWGWNEHGNCGPGKEDVVTVKTLDVPLATCRRVAAGYGTSFIW